jgi:hypothetical protein
MPPGSTAFGNLPCFQLVVFLAGAFCFAMRYARDAHLLIH